MSKRRVLVYDDDADAVGRLLVLVKLLGHEAVGTVHVSEGSDALNTAPFDLLLARLGMSGYDLAVIASAKRPGVEVVFIAGEASASASGAFVRHPVLREPYTREQVESILSRAFALHGVKVAASTYIQTVRTACAAPGSGESTEALATAAKHIEAVRGHVKTVLSGDPGEAG